MNDIAAVTGQLARLRESLQQKQQELDGMATFSDAERTRSIQFIGKLMQACRGHDRELDSRLAKLKQKLDGNPPLSSLTPISPSSRSCCSNMATPWRSPSV